MTKRMPGLPLAALILAFLLTGCGKGAAPEEEAAKPLVEVSVRKVVRGDIRSTLTVTGTLSPLPDQEAKITALAPGRIKQVFVKTGDVVKKGQTVATLDPGAASGQVQQAEGALKVAEATLSQAKINLTSQTRAQSASAEQARINVQAQTVALQKLRAGSRPQEIAQAQASVTSARAALTNAEQNLSRSQTLYSQGLLARKDLEAAEAQEQTARAALASAEQSLSLARQGNRPEDIRAGEVALDLAKQQLRSAEAQAIQNQSKQQDVRIAEGQVNSARGALQSAIAQAKALTIVSPVAGTVVGRTINSGESVDVTTAIATIVNLDQIRVMLGVPSDQIARLAKGQEVEFTADANPEVKHTARVKVINRSIDPATNAVQVEAVADNKDRSLRDDGLVKAIVVTALHESAILAPATAIVAKDEKTVVFVAGEDGIAHSKEVKTGASEGDQVQIVSGLVAGQTVVTTGAYELEDGTKIKVSK